MAKIAKLMLISLLWLLPLLLFADLSGFRDDVQKTEKEKPAATPQPDTDTQTDQDKKTDKDNNAFGEFIVGVFRFFSLFANSYTMYGDYPYQEGGYVFRDAGNPDHPPAALTSPKIGAAEKRDQWFSAEVQGIWMRDLGVGTWVSFKGHFYRFFGPYLENWTLLDGANVLNGTRLGLTLALFQSDPFTASVYGQWTHWAGILTRDGGTVGLEIRMYPLKPLAFQFKAGFQLFNSFSLGEIEAQLGVDLQQFELFAGWRWWNLLNFEGSLRNSYNGPYAGVRLYF